MYTVTNKIEKMDLFAEGVENVLQCIRTLLTSSKGTVPLDREFGIGYDLLGGCTLDELNKLEG